MLDEGEEHGVKLFGADLDGEPVEAGGHNFRVELLAVAGHEDMAGLVDETHCVELARMNGAVGMALGLADLVHAEGKLAAGGHIGEDDVACG